MKAEDITTEVIQDKTNAAHSASAATYNLVFTGNHGTARAICREARDHFDDLLRLLNDEIGT